MGDGSWCFSYLDRDGNLASGTVCAEDVFCAEVQRCLRRTDCPSGYSCITFNGCTRCAGAYGVCSKRCRKGLGDAPGVAHHRSGPLGRRTAKIRLTQLGRTATGR